MKTDLFYRARSDEFTSSNPILSEGEIGYEIDTKRWKLGNGENKWSDLVYSDNFATDVDGHVTGFIGSDGEVISFAGAAYTFENLPPATPENAGASVRVTDIGVAGVGTVWISVGTHWIPLNGSAFVARNSLPIIIPSSGSMGNNGAITLTTALPVIYANCYMYFPANAIQAGSLAGIYYVEMSSTTIGIVYNNLYTGGTPTVPTKVAFVTTGSGAYTQTTGGSDIPLLYATLPANSLGLYGGIRYEFTTTYNNSAGTKTLRSKYGTYTAHSAAPSTSVVYVGKTGLVNSGATNLQRTLTNDSLSGLSTGSGTALGAVGAIDSTASQVVALAGNLQTATDYLVLVCGVIEITG